MKIKYKIKIKEGYEYDGTVYYKGVLYWHNERKEMVKIEEFTGDSEYDDTGFIHSDQGCVIKAPSLKGTVIWTYLKHLKPLLHENKI